MHEEFQEIKIESDYDITIFTSSSLFMLWLGEINHMMLTLIDMGGRGNLSLSVCCATNFCPGLSKFLEKKIKKGIYSNIQQKINLLVPKSIFHNIHSSNDIQLPQINSVFTSYRALIREINTIWRKSRWLIADPPDVRLIFHNSYNGFNVVFLH